MLCVEFGTRTVSKDDEQYVLGALNGVGIVSALVAGVAMQSHFTPPGFGPQQGPEAGILVEGVVNVRQPVFVAFVVLNSIALFTALAALAVSVAFPALLIIRVADGNNEVRALPLSVRKTHAAVVAPVKRYESMSKSLTYAVWFLLASVVSFAAALFVVGFLAAFHNPTTIVLFVIAFGGIVGTLFACMASTESVQRGATLKQLECRLQVKHRGTNTTCSWGPCLPPSRAARATTKNPNRPAECQGAV